jgi:hypothetical protein
MSAKTLRRSYHRRTDDERIAELQGKIEALKARQVERESKVDPVLKEIPKIQRRLKRFALLANQNGRLDIANSVTAFVGGLERMLRVPPARPARPAAADEEPA